MMVHAVRDLGGGIYHGVTGIVVEPYRRTKVSRLCSCSCYCCWCWFSYRLVAKNVSAGRRRGTADRMR